MSGFLQELLSPEMIFLRYALIFGVLSSLLIGAVGTMVVTRRVSSLAGAVSHAVLGGVGIALFLQRVFLWQWCSPMLGAVIGAVSAALVVGLVNLYAKEREDTIIAVVWALGMSLGLLFLHKTPGYVDWQGYLFGNILLISDQALYLTAALSVLTLIPAVFFYNGILAMSFDGTFAELRGVKVKLYYLALLIFTALTIVLLINVVGIILVIALLTLPAATAGCFTRHLWSTMLAAGVLSCIFVVCGLLLSYYYRMPSGPVITLLAAGCYIAGLFISSWRKRRG